ncbi:MAG TPA: response regulator, partial [Pelobium sp.]|nr:response regulator [Pelobium sp.]
KEPLTAEINIADTNNKFAFNILIVEDNLINKLLAKTVIARILPNAHISEANNGLEAIESYQIQRPDLIFMDLQMPIMNGYDATKKIRALAKDNKAHQTVIVALTAGNIKGEKERCLEIGMDDFITKPFIEDDLAALFAKWLTKNTLPIIKEAEQEVKASHFDNEKLKLFMGNDSQSVKLVLSLTIQELIKAETNFTEILKKPDLKSITALGHKLFGTASGTGLDALAVLSREIEYQEDIDEKRLQNLHALLKKEIALVISLIEEELETLN